MGRTNHTPPPVAPVKTWAQMSELERAAVKRDLRPPRPRPEPILPSPRARTSERQKQVDDGVTLSAGAQLRSTPKAVLYRLEMDDGSVEAWIPRSAILEADEMDDGTVVLVVARWLAVKEGWV